MESVTRPAQGPTRNAADDLPGRTLAMDRMGKQEFLKLLIAQLRNQDPMNPMEDREFITQLAQFSSLEALDNVGKQLDGLARSQTLTQAAGLIGKRIEARLADGSAVTGPVAEVRFVNGAPRLVVDDHVLDIAQIVAVYS
jgi:flagellar basal-body rod modification protein FlgD